MTITFRKVKSKFLRKRNLSSSLKAKFKHHSAITGTFIRFITRQMAESSAAGLGAKVSVLETLVWELKNKSASKDLVNKVDNKLESVIRANDLKKKE